MFEKKDPAHTRSLFAENLKDTTATTTKTTAMTVGNILFIAGDGMAAELQNNRQFAKKQLAKNEQLFRRTSAQVVTLIEKLLWIYIFDDGKVV